MIASLISRPSLIICCLDASIIRESGGEESLATYRLSVLGGHGFEFPDRRASIGFSNTAVLVLRHSSGGSADRIQVHPAPRLLSSFLAASVEYGR